MRTGIIIVLLLPCFIAIADTKVYLSIENKNPQVGDDIVLNIQCITSKNAFVVFPDYTTRLQPLEIVSPITYDTLPKGRNTLYACTLHLRAWDSATVIIPALPVVVDNTTSVDTIFTKSQPLSVSMIYADTTKPIKDIFPPISKEVTLWQKIAPYIKYVSVGLLALMGLGIIFLILYLSNKNKNKIKRATNYIPNGVSPYNWCTFHIQKAGDIEDLNLRYARLSEILRLYIEFKYSIPALALTTEELLPILSSSSIPATLQEAIAKFLSSSDYYKFSPHTENTPHAETDALIILIQKLETDALG